MNLSLFHNPPHEYREVLEQATSFLRGHRREVERRIARDMDAAAKAKQLVG